MLWLKGLLFLYLVLWLFKCVVIVFMFIGFLFRLILVKENIFFIMEILLLFIVSLNFCLVELGFMILIDL